MDWQDYKAICARPDVFSRELLAWTCSVLGDGEIAGTLRSVLTRAHVDKPADGVDDVRLDMFRLALSVQDVEAIVSRLEAEPETDSSRLRHARIVWREYQDHLQNLQRSCTP